MKSETAISVAILSLITGTLFAISVMILPYLIEKNIKNSNKTKSLLQINNNDMWCQFPGRLNYSINHIFDFYQLITKFDMVYNQLNKNKPFNKSNLIGINVSLIENQSLNFVENINYNDSIFSDQTDTVITNKTSEYLRKNYTNIKIPGLSLSNLEIISTISNPPLYQLAISSIYNTLFKIIQQNFKAKLFTIFSYGYIIKNKEIVNESILKNYPNIYDHDQYGFSEIRTYYNWVLLMYNPEKIKDATWLQSVFNLTTTQVSSLIGEKSYLGLLNYSFNQNLDSIIGCSGHCSDSQLMVYQILYANITKNNLFNFENIRDLYNQFEEYPYDFDIEFPYFFGKYYNSTQYEKIVPLSKQLNSLFNITDTGSLSSDAANSSFFFAKNIIDLYYYNQTGDLMSVFNKFKITSKESMNFLCDYLFSYQLNNFGLLNFNDQNINYQGASDERAFTLLSIIAIKASINKIKDNIKLVLLSKIIYNSIIQEKKDCNYYVSRVVNDSRLQGICDNVLTDMKSYNSVKIWVKSLNDTVSLKYLQNLTNFTDLEMSQFFNSTNFGNAINVSEIKITKQYNCNDICTPEFLAMLQWGQSLITLSPPDIIKDQSVKSLSLWDNTIFLISPEYYYYTEKYDANIDFLTVKGLYYLNSISALVRMQKIIILLNRNVINSKIFESSGILNPQEFFMGIRLFTQNTLFSDLLSEYSIKELIEGGKFNSNWLNQGNYFDGFKPNLTKTTSLLMNDSSIYKMRTGRDSDKNTRNVISINNANVYNSFSNILNGDKYINYNIPNFNKERIKQNSNDGFQNSPANNKVYYLDSVSSRSFLFESNKNTKKNNLKCREYLFSDKVNQANETYENIYDEFGTVFTKSNKNLIVSRKSLFSSNKISSNFLTVYDNTTKDLKELEDDSYLCFDMFSDYLVDGQIKLLFSIYTNSTRLFFPSLPENAIIPIAVYTKTVSLDSNIFTSIFKGVKSFNELKTLLILIGIVVSIASISVSLFFFIKFKNLKKSDYKIISN